MTVLKDSHGITMTRSGLTSKVINYKLGGWEKQTIGLTTHSNTTTETSGLGTLKKWDDLVLTLEFDPSVYYGTISAGNASTVITFPNAAGSVTFWADVKKVGELSAPANSGERPSYELTLIITNLNGSNVETPPVFA